MENQGFEEEHQPGSRAAESSFPRIDFVAHASVSHVADGHVYEDILPGVEQVSRILSSPNQSPQTPNSDHRKTSESTDDRVPKVSSRSVKVCSSPTDQEAESCGFRRNLTLPFRRSSGLDPPGASSSVRVTSREKKTGWREDNAENSESVSPIDKDREVSVQTQSAEARPNRRRRKKDCKHCRSKAVAFSYDRECEIDENEEETVLKRNRDNRRQFHQVIANDPRSILDPCDLGVLRTCGSPAGLGDTVAARMGNDPLCVFTISEKVARSPGDQKLIEYEGNRIQEKSAVSQQKSRGMRVNSIYSQDRWYAKEAAIFCTDAKEHGSFQVSCV